MTPTIKLTPGSEPGERLLNLKLTLNSGEAIQLGNLLYELGWETMGLHLQKVSETMEQEEGMTR